jgi:hypothetical protein
LPHRRRFSSGGISPIFAALYSQRLRSLELSDSDAHDNWPPEAFKPFVAMVAAGGLPETVQAMPVDKTVYRAALAPAYERAEAVANDTIKTFLRAFTRSPQWMRDLERFINAFDCRHTVHIQPQLACLQAPTLIAWGADDIYFRLEGAQWLAKTIPGTKRRVELKSAQVFFHGSARENSTGSCVSIGPAPERMQPWKSSHAVGGCGCQAGMIPGLASFTPRAVLPGSDSHRHQYHARNGVLRVSARPLIAQRSA